MFVVKKSLCNPVLSSVKGHCWETEAAFNWSPAMSGSDKKTIHCVYRAMSEPYLIPEPCPHISSIGYAVSKDGIHYTGRRQLIKPEFEWERYGCEDPRVTRLNGKYYIFYTALSAFPFKAQGIRVACAITRDFKKIEAKHLVTPFNAKAMALFPSKVNGRMAAILTVNTDNAKRTARVALATFEHEEDIWNPLYWKNWYRNMRQHILHVRRTISDHIEVGAAPLKTNQGWLLIYAHIQNYHSKDRIFGIEALLLDQKDPRRIIGRTKHPMLIPEDSHDRYGQVPNVIFPSGALIVDGDVWIFYGAADTVSCIARVRLKDLLHGIYPLKKDGYVFRLKKNPVISPVSGHEWESKATFNPAAIELEGKIHILYRAMSEDNTSTLGYAASSDGVNIDERLPEPVYVPREEFEMKKVANGNSGCEDPRIARIGNKLYMCYTAYNGVEPPRVALSSISVKDFLNRNWNWSKPALITPPNMDDKDACILPDKVDGQYMFIHRLKDHICVDFLNSLERASEDVTKGVRLMGPRYGMWDSKKIGMAGPPLKTKKGWILFYHGVGEDCHYRLGAALLDLKNPLIVLSRTTTPIIEPEKKYEREGQVQGVVFPCGHVCRGDSIYTYYGGGDSVIGIVKITLSKLLSVLS